MKDIKVGQKCYMVLMNVGRNEGIKITDAEVSKSGNKYITVDDRYRFELRNGVWTEDDYCGEGRYLFFSKEDVKDHIDNFELQKYLMNKAHRMYAENVSAEKLRKVYEILEDKLYIGFDISGKLTLKEKVDFINRKTGSSFAVECGEKCINFYYKQISKGFGLLDADDYAQLNTLFGYDIGEENFRKLNDELWERDIRASELNPDEDSKEEVMDICNAIGLEMNFSKWRMEPINEYLYF